MGGPGVGPGPGPGHLQMVDRSVAQKAGRLAGCCPVPPSPRNKFVQDGNRGSLVDTGWCGSKKHDLSKFGSQFADGLANLSAHGVPPRNRQLVLKMRDQQQSKQQSPGKRHCFTKPNNGLVAKLHSMDQQNFQDT